jgi:uncharacterized protein (DUF1697 family)
MPTFVALLRGINVGKARRIPMAELRALVGELGHTGVVTLLNSGNVVFNATSGTSTRHAREIAAAISTRLNVEVPVIVKSAKELAAIVAENRLAGQAVDPSRLLVAFTQDARALSSLGAIGSLVLPPERFEVGLHAAYLYCAAGILESKAGKALLGQAGKCATTRNWATILKLQALASEPDA